MISADIKRRVQPGRGTGMNEFELTITIDRPIKAVWAYFQDFSKYPKWNPGMNQARQTSPGRTDVSGTLAFANENPEGLAGG